jgi:hypothetical protein
MLIRTTLVCLAAAVAAIAGATASEAPRAAGAYTSLTTRDAAACARACADDGICMAWSYHRESQCQLSAVVAAPDPQALATGFATRAPAFLQLRTPDVHAEAGEPPPQPAPQFLAEAPVADPSAAPPEPAFDDSVLLGGPGEGDLRLGLR